MVFLRRIILSPTTLRILEPTREHQVFISLITHVTTKDCTLRRQQKPIHDVQTFEILLCVVVNTLLSFIACDGDTICSVKNTEFQPMGDFSTPTPRNWLRDTWQFMHCHTYLPKPTVSLILCLENWSMTRRREKLMRSLCGCRMQGCKR